MSHDELFRLRVALTNREHGNKVLAVTAWEGPWQAPNHTRIDIRARLMWTENGKRRSRTVFKRGQTWCGIPGHSSIDGKFAKECVLSTLAMKPGDTDAEYFASYTPAQLEFANEFGETLDMEKQFRYCDPETGEVKE